MISFFLLREPEITTIKRRRSNLTSQDIHTLLCICENTLDLFKTILKAMEADIIKRPDELCHIQNSF